MKYPYTSKNREQAISWRENWEETFFMEGETINYGRQSDFNKCHIELNPGVLDVRNAITSRCDWKKMIILDGTSSGEETNNVVADTA